MTSAATNHALSEGTDQPLRSAVVPLVGSLVFTGVAVLSICGLPRTHTLTWFGVFGYAVCYVLIALLAHAIAMWAVCRGLQDRMEVSTGPLIVGLWMVIKTARERSRAGARLAVREFVPVPSSHLEGFCRHADKGVNLAPSVYPHWVKLHLSCLEWRKGVLSAPGFGRVSWR
jgi:hypothetical protein